MTSGDKLRHPAPSSPLTLDHGLTVLNDETVDSGTASDADTDAVTRINARNKSRAPRQRMIHSISIIPLLHAHPPLVPKLP